MQAFPVKSHKAQNSKRKKERKFVFVVTDKRRVVTKQKVKEGVVPLSLLTDGIPLLCVLFIKNL